MKIAYFQCTAGISGDMILGALVDSGLKLETLKSELMKLNLPFDLRSRHVLKNGIKGTKVQVVVNEGHVHRNLNDIKSIVQKSGFKGKVKENIIKIFTNLAEAEAKVHGTSVEAVHFHEVGAMDSIIDICGAAAGLDLLGIEKIYCSPIHIGTGFTKCAHGIIPLPAPAVVQLLHGIKIYSKGVEKELVTPTGAAVISTLCSNFGEIPPMNVESCGCGAGDRDLEIPNLLRIYVGQLEQGIKNNLVREGKAVKIEANIDDMNPQFYEYISQRLFSAGAADVYMQTAFMKKNRIGNILCVNTCDENMDNVLKVIFEETTTIGVKVFNFHKYMLPYEIKKISTKLGEFSVKVAFYGDRVSNISPEYEECRERARECGIPVKEVYDIVKRAAVGQNMI